MPLRLRIEVDIFHLLKVCFLVWGEASSRREISHWEQLSRWQEKVLNWVELIIWVWRKENLFSHYVRH